jgi:hypothetical protein
MRDASPEGFHCACCRRFIPTALPGLSRAPRTGSPQRFCSPGCRQAAYRRRRAGVPEDVPLAHRGGGRRRLAPPAR